MSSVWNSPAPAARFFIRFPSPWQMLRGMGFGLREPAMVGDVHASVPGRFDPVALDRLMERLTTESLPEDIGGETNGASLVARVVFWAGAIQRRAQIPVFGRAYLGSPRGEEGGEAMFVAIPCFEAAASFAAIRWLEAACNDLLAGKQLFEGRADKAEAQWAELGKSLRPFRPKGQNNFKYLRDAHAQNIPVQQFLPGMHCFGIGARSRWLQSSVTDRTAILAAKICDNKYATAKVLRRAGLPAATHALVNSSAEAIKTAKALGYPVVVKPADRHLGIGIASGLKDDAAVTAAFEEALKFSKNILVEKHFDGIDYRMVVLNGRLVRVKDRLPGGVIGDGKNTIAQLVDLKEQEPARIQRARVRGQQQLLELDDEAIGLLSENGLSPDSVPAPDQYVRLRRRGNVSAGATSNKIELEDVHPDNIRLAERSAAAVRLDFGGLDVIMPDIRRSWMETGAVICEINVVPQSTGETLALLVEGDGRIPVVLVLGKIDCVDWHEIRRKLSAHAGLGFASVDGAWVDGERLTGKQPNSLVAGQILLNNLQTEAAVIVMSPAEVRRFGLPTDQFDAVILDSLDNWSDPDRVSASDVLDLVLPHSLMTLSVQADQSFGTEQLRHRSQASWQVCPEPVQQTCERVFAGLLSRMQGGIEAASFDATADRADLGV